MNTTFEQKIRGTRSVVSFFVIFSLAFHTGAQTGCSAYSTLWQGPNKWIYTGIAVHAGINYFAEKQKSLASVKVRNFKWFTDNPRPCDLNKKAAHISDGIITANFCLGLVASLANAKQNKATVLTELTQSTFIAINLCQTVKISVNRGRPYTYGRPSTDFKTRNDAYSFYSGHSTSSAAVSTTLWLNRSKLSSNKKINNVICFTSTLMTLSTAGLRIKANKHYPSDVLIGLTTGIGVSLLVHQVQRSLR